MASIFEVTSTPIPKSSNEQKPALQVSHPLLFPTGTQITPTPDKKDLVLQLSSILPSLNYTGPTDAQSHTANIASVKTAASARQMYEPNLSFIEPRLRNLLEGNKPGDYRLPEGLVKATPAIIQEEKPTATTKEDSSSYNLTNANPSVIQILDEIFDKSRKSDMDVNDYFLEYMKNITSSVDDKAVSDIKKNIADYIKSPLYAKRQRMNPEFYQKSIIPEIETKDEYNEKKSFFEGTIASEKRKYRLKQLESVPVEISNTPNLTDNFYSPKKDLVKIESKNTPSIVSHELAHSITAEGFVKDKNNNYLKDEKGEFIPKGAEYSDTHNWRYFNSPIKTKEGEKERAGLGLNWAEVSKFMKLAKSNPNEKGGVMNDEHYYQTKSGFAYEQYGDLYGVRKLLYDNGITKSFGENIDKDKMKEILKNKNITTDPVFKRFFNKYGEDNVIELNNTIAMNNKFNANENKMA